jgi:hypothetical protein
VILQDYCVAIAIAIAIGIAVVVVVIVVCCCCFVAVKFLVPIHLAASLEGLPKLLLSSIIGKNC